MTRTTLTTLLAVLLAAVTLAACGGDDGGSDTGTGATATTAGPSTTDGGGGGGGADADEDGGDAADDGSGDDVATAPAKGCVVREIDYDDTGLERVSGSGTIAVLVPPRDVDLKIRPLGARLSGGVEVGDQSIEPEDGRFLVIRYRVKNAGDTAVAPSSFVVSRMIVGGAGTYYGSPIACTAGPLATAAARFDSWNAQLEPGASRKAVAVYVVPSSADVGRWVAPAEKRYFRIDAG